jgi:hypothetical protein
MISGRRQAELGRSGGAAVVAGAVEHDVVFCEVVPLSAGDPCESTFEPRVVELVDPAAFVADQVVMVLTTWECRLEARRAGAEIDAVHEAEVGELFEHSVDACDPDAVAVGA